MSKTFVGLIAATLLMSAPVAFGFDGGPLPGWDRLADNTVFADWEFSSSGTTAWPDAAILPNGINEPYITIEGEPNDWDYATDWPCPNDLEDTPGSGTTSGWHCDDPNGGKITVTVDNIDNQNEMKRIFLQVTSTKAPSGVTPTGSGSAGAGGYTSGTFDPNRPHSQHPGPVPPTGGTWYTYNYGLTIQPNPDSETITIEVPFCTVIEQIVVDTECTPEPATLSLLCLGGLAFIRRRR